jgi:hypothetical protein
MDDRNASTESVPLADLAAEAVNEGSPAQTMPETLPPQARRKKDETRGDETPTRSKGKPRE